MSSDDGMKRWGAYCRHGVGGREYVRERGRCCGCGGSGSGMEEVRGKERPRYMCMGQGQHTNELVDVRCNAKDDGSVVPEGLELCLPSHAYFPKEEVDYREPEAAHQLLQAHIVEEVDHDDGRGHSLADHRVPEDRYEEVEPDGHPKEEEPALLHHLLHVRVHLPTLLPSLPPGRCGRRGSHPDAKLFTQLLGHHHLGHPFTTRPLAALFLLDNSPV